MFEIWAAAAAAKRILNCINVCDTKQQDKQTQAAAEVIHRQLLINLLRNPLEKDYWTFPIKHRQNTGWGKLGGFYSMSTLVGLFYTKVNVFSSN